MNAGGPNYTSLEITNSPAPAAPAQSNFPDPETGVGDVTYNVFFVGGCRVGAIVTVDPPDAVITDFVWYAADMGVAQIGIGVLPGRNYILRAWSDDGVYLGEYSGEG